MDEEVANVAPQNAQVDLPPEPKRMAPSRPQTGQWLRDGSGYRVSHDSLKHLLEGQ